MKNNMLILILIWSSIACSSCGTTLPEPVVEEIPVVVSTITQVVADLLIRVGYVEVLCEDMLKTTEVAEKSDALFACTSINDAKLYVLARQERYESALNGNNQAAIDDALPKLEAAADQLKKALDQQNYALTRKLIKNE